MATLSVERKGFNSIVALCVFLQWFQFFSVGFYSIEGLLDQFCKVYYRICARGGGPIPRGMFYPSLHLSFQLSMNQPIYQSNFFLSINLFLDLCIFLSSYLSINQFLYLPCICQSFFHLYIYLSSYFL